MKGLSRQARRGGERWVRAGVCAAFVLASACSGRPGDVWCGIPKTYGSIVSFDAEGVHGSGTGGVAFYGSLMQGSPDQVGVELSPRGRLASGIRAGMFDLEAEDPDDCAICVVIWRPRKTWSWRGVVTATDIYAAVGGTLTIASAGERLSGSLSNVTLRRVEGDGGEYERQRPVGCSVRIEYMEFSVSRPLNPWDGAMEGKGRLPRL